MNRVWVGLFIVVTVFLATGCGHVLSESARSSVDLTEGYSQFVRDPQDSVGRTLLLAGIVVSHQVSREGTVLTLLPYTVDRRGVPKRPVRNAGEFLARSERILDPNKFGSGHLVTLVATYVGREPRSVADKQFGRPLFEVGEIYGWPKVAHYPYGYRYPFRIY